MSDERRRRPPMERQGPHRDFANLLGAAGRRVPNAAGSRTPPSGADPAQAGAQFVEQGVRAAYEVIDTYLRQGQRVAQQFGGLSYGPAQLGNNASELQARWLRLSTDLMAGWFDLLGWWAESMTQPNTPPPPASTGGVAPPSVTGAPPAASVAAAPAAAPVATAPAAASAVADSPSIPVVVEIASRRLAQLRLEFLPGRETDQLASHGLQAAPPAAVIPVAFRRNADGPGIVVSLRIADHQPPGLYSAALLHAQSGDCVGTLSLKLSD